MLAAQACHDLALAYETPFISGKDSLNNEYSHDGQSLAIPSTLLISAIGQVPDVRACVTMDFKSAGNLIVVLGTTRNELGGSLWAEVQGRVGGRVPAVVPQHGRAVFQAVHQAIGRGLVRSCHDLSEGGLAVALAEMAIAGGLGASVSLRDVPCEDAAASDLVLLFSESPSRFLLEVPPQNYAALADLAGSVPIGRLGEVTDGPGAGATAARQVDRPGARGLARDRRLDRRPERRLAATIAVVIVSAPEAAQAPSPAHDLIKKP